MKTIKIRETSFKNMFENILSINYTEDWEMIPTDDDSENPLVVFKTTKWKKLYQLIKDFTDKNGKEFTEDTTNFDLIVGSLLTIQYKIELSILKNN